MSGLKDMELPSDALCLLLFLGMRDGREEPAGEIWPTVLEFLADEITPREAMLSPLNGSPKPMEDLGLVGADAIGLDRYEMIILVACKL